MPAKAKTPAKATPKTTQRTKADAATKPEVNGTESLDLTADATDATDATDAGNSGATQQDTADDSGDDTDGPADTAKPVSAAPAKKIKDPKIMMIAGVLADFPAGISIGDIADECGLGPTTVDKLLYIMESQGAAVMIAADAGKGTPELWMSGTTRATDVDLSLVPAPANHCPTCKCGGGYRSRSAASIRRVSLDPGKNSDGSRKFGKGELRQLVHDLVNEFGNGHVHTATSVTNELMERLDGKEISSGAVLNNLRTLAATGQITLHTERPEQFTANPADTEDTDASDGTDGDSGE